MALVEVTGTKWDLVFQELTTIYGLVEQADKYYLAIGVVV